MSSSAYSRKRTSSADAQKNAALYLQCEAYRDPRAQALASELKMSLCTPRDQFQGVTAYMDRLVSTGRDQPYELSVWFGPYWQEGTKHIQRQCRIATLCMPATNYANPYVGQPRPPSPEESMELRAMWDFSSQSIRV